MEGLIPLIYKAIRRKKNRSCYRSLSSAEAAAFDDVAATSSSNGNRPAMFMTPPPKNHKAAFEMAQFDGNRPVFMTPPPEKFWSSDQGRGYGHRRYASLREFPHDLPTEKRSTKFSRARSLHMLAFVNGG